MVFVSSQIPRQCQIPTAQGSGTKGGVPWFQEFNHERAHLTMASGHQLSPHLSLTCCTSSAVCACAYLLLGWCWVVRTKTQVTHTLPGGEQQPFLVCGLTSSPTSGSPSAGSTAQIYQLTFSWVVLPKLGSICTLLACFILGLTPAFSVCEHLDNLICCQSWFCLRICAYFLKFYSCGPGKIILSMSDGLDPFSSETFWMPGSSQLLMV